MSQSTRAKERAEKLAHGALYGALAAVFAVASIALVVPTETVGAAEWILTVTVAPLLGAVVAWLRLRRTNAQA
jgi:hypothetical protein